MNLRDLSYLVALADERHFRRAAERCYVSQPTLSGQLKKLEEELGVQLVERRGRRITITEAGEAISAQARKVLAEANMIKAIAGGFRDPMAGRLQLGVIPTVAPYLLPLFIPALSSRYPDLKLYLHERQTAVLLDKLRNAELDLLLLALPVDTDEFAEIDLFREPFWLTVPASDPLAKRKTASVNDLEAREVLLLEEGHCLRGQALDICLAAGANEFEGFRATSLETLRQMVGEGLGITLVPELAVPAKQEGSVCYVPFKKPVPDRRIGLLYRKGSYREEAINAIAELVREGAGRALRAPIRA